MCITFQLVLNLLFWLVLSFPAFQMWAVVMVVGPFKHSSIMLCYTYCATSFYCTVLCLDVRLSVRPSHAVILSKRLNITDFFTVK